MSPAKQQMKKRKPANKTDKEEENIDLRGSQDSTENAHVEKPSKKHPSSDFDDDDADGTGFPVGAGFQSMLEWFRVDINKAMQAKKKRLGTLTRNYMKGSQHTLEQLWGAHQSRRQRLTQQFGRQVSAALQQWEAERSEEHEEKMSSLFKQQIEVLQQARAAQGQKLKAVRELYELFRRNTEEMQRSHDAFLQGAKRELKKEMNELQKKILMDTQQQEMANVRKSLSSILF